MPLNVYFGTHFVLIGRTRKTPYQCLQKYSYDINSCAVSENTLRIRFHYLSTYVININTPVKGSVDLTQTVWWPRQLSAKMIRFVCHAEIICSIVFISKIVITLHDDRTNPIILCYPGQMTYMYILCFRMSSIRKHRWYPQVGMTYTKPHPYILVNDTVLN